nr:MAG TPA: hypothetical protein [Caudoviricetes sp.]
MHKKIKINLCKVSNITKNPPMNKLFSSKDFLYFSIYLSLYPHE